MLPDLPPEVVVRLVRRDPYPELRDSLRPKAHPPAAEPRRLRPGALGAILAKFRTAGVTAAIAARAAPVPGADCPLPRRGRPG